MNTRSSFLLFSLLISSLFSCAKQIKPITPAIEKPNPDQRTVGFDESALLKEGYVKVFEDNFSSDLSKWNIWEGGAYNNELQLYQSQNLSLENGNLVIRAKKEQVQGKILPGNSAQKAFGFTSGRIESKQSVSANDATPVVRMSARIQLALGTGMWPAFWAYGNPWPTQGEIDILEGTGQPDNYITNYFYGKNAGKSDANGKLTVKKVVAPYELTSSFHIYELIWTKSSLTYLLDGKVVDLKSASTEGGEYIPEFYEKTQNVILNLAVGGDIFGPLNTADIKTGTMYVDWVKVFTKSTP